MDKSPWRFSLSELSALILQWFINYSSFFPAQCWFTCLFQLRSLCSGKFQRLCLRVCFFNLRICNVLYVLFFLMNLRKVGFSVCSAFCLLLGQSSDFQAPYMWKKKLFLWISLCPAPTHTHPPKYVLFNHPSFISHTRVHVCVHAYMPGSVLGAGNIKIDNT